MSAEPLLPIYLVAGSDRPKVKLALRRLRARFPEESLEVISAEEATGQDAVAACNALGLFGGGGARLVIVEGVEKWKAPDAEALAAYLGDPVPGAVLALVSDEQLKSSKLPELCARAGRVLTYDAPKPRDLPTWVRAQFEQLGVVADGEAARALVGLVGDDVLTLSNEVQKLAAWAAGEPIGRREVETLAVPAGSEAGWVLTDAWGGRDLAGALEACESALEHEKPFVLAMKLASYVGRVKAVQALAEEGLGTSAIAKRLRIHEYPARKAAAHAQNYSRDELDAAVIRLAELDAALKGASRLDEELELERALIDVTRRLEPAERR